LTANARAFSLEALTAMRPRLRVARSPRRLTVLRVFARPFEDLLYVASGTQAKRPGQIARRAIMPCWTVVAARIAPGLLADLERALAGSTLADPEWVPRFGPLLWPAAAAAARQVLDELASGPAARAALVAALGGEHVAAELADMVELLAIADTVEDLRHVLGPGPIIELDERLAAAVSTRFRALADRGQGARDALAYFVIARMAFPIELARVYGGADCDDAGLHALGVIAARVIQAEIGAVVSEVAAPVPTLDAAALAGRAEAVAAQLRELREGVREGRFAGSLAEIDLQQQRLCEAVTHNVLAGAGALIADALERPQAVPAARAAQREAVESRARALWKCTRFAGAIGLERDVRETVAAVEEQTSRLALAPITALAAAPAEPAPAAIEAARATLIHAVRVLELVAGPDEAEALQHRGMAALARLRA
jgi:hypothetical protein